MALKSPTRPFITITSMFCFIRSRERPIHSFYASSALRWAVATPSFIDKWDARRHLYGRRGRLLDWSLGASGACREFGRISEKIVGKLWALWNTDRASTRLRNFLPVGVSSANSARPNINDPSARSAESPSHTILWIGPDEDSAPGSGKPNYLTVNLVGRRRSRPAPGSD